MWHDPSRATWLIFFFLSASSLCVSLSLCLSLYVCLSSHSVGENKHPHTRYLWQNDRMTWKTDIEREIERDTCDMTHWHVKSREDLERLLHREHEAGVWGVSMSTHFLTHAIFIAFSLLSRFFFLERVLSLCVLHTERNTHRERTDSEEHA